MTKPYLRHGEPRRADPTHCANVSLPFYGSCNKGRERPPLQRHSSAGGAGGEGPSMRSQDSHVPSPLSPLYFPPILHPVQAAASQVQEQYGQLGLVVNTAGLLHEPGGMRPGRLPTTAWPLSAQAADP